MNIFLGFVAGIGFMLFYEVFPMILEIQSGENFIYGNATYRCEKTNELLEEK